MKIWIICSLTVCTVGCQTTKSRKVSKRKKSIRTVLSSPVCKSSEGPELVKNGNFELSEDEKVSFWKSITTDSIFEQDQNRKLSLKESSSASQDITYKTSQYIVSFDYYNTGLSRDSFEVELLGQKVSRVNVSSRRTRFNHIFSGDRNHCIVIKSLSGDNILIDNISVKPVSSACLQRYRAAVEKPSY